MGSGEGCQPHVQPARRREELACILGGFGRNGERREGDGEGKEGKSAGRIESPNVRSRVEDGEDQGRPKRVS
jgi:hypothetical protein